jgi:hypothetical protein
MYIQNVDRPLCYERVQVQTLTMLLTRANFRHTRWLSCHLFILAGRSFEFYHPSGPQLHALCGTSISHDQRGTERQSILQLDVKWFRRKIYAIGPRSGSNV